MFKRGILAAAAAAALLAVPGVAGAVDDPSVLSPASQALFIKPHLASIKKPSVLVYGFQDGGTLEKGFADTVEAEITNVNADGTKDMTFHFLSGVHNLQFRDFFNQTRNPIPILFLERDVREMQKVTRGNALYFRNRIKNALAGSAKIKDVSFDFGGKTLKGTEITIEPYAQDPLNERYPRFAKKKYEFILSDEIPGGIYKVTAATPNPATGKPLTYDAITFQEVHAPDVKKAQAESPGTPN